MKNAFRAFTKGKITRAEMYRYQTLHKALMGDDKFVEVQDTPEWKEFNRLSTKINCDKNE